MPPPPTPSLLVASDVLRTVRAALEKAGRKEPCGYLLGRRRTGRAPEILVAVPGRNVHPTPAYAFRLTPEEQLVLRRAARGVGLDVVGTWHGHRHGRARPGRADRQALALPGLACMLIAARESGEAVVRAYARSAEDGRCRALAVRAATSVPRPSWARASSRPA